MLQFNIARLAISIVSLILSMYGACTRRPGIMRTGQFGAALILISFVITEIGA